ncbi:MAG TPA: hypothetical protein DDW50_04370 [Firmicutes bacterium]|jgi:hypothetical protein|nr:hypothetical protein [Bacillota bacterium]
MADNTGYSGIELDFPALTSFMEGVLKILGNSCNNGQMSSASQVLLRQMDIDCRAFKTSVDNSDEYKLAD